MRQPRYWVANSGSVRILSSRSRAGEQRASSGEPGQRSLQAQLQSPPPRVIGPAGRRSCRRPQGETPIGAAWEGKTKRRKPEGGIKFLLHAPPTPSCPVQVVRDTQYLKFSTRSCVSGYCCLGRTEVPRSRYTSPISPGVARPAPGGGPGGRGGAGGGAAPGSVCRCQCVCPSLLHCLPPPPPPLPLPLPESPQPPASRVAATPSDRWEATQVGPREPRGLREPRPPPRRGLHPDRSWPGESMCLPAGAASCLSVGKLPLHPLPSHIPRSSAPEWRPATCHIWPPLETLGLRAGGGPPRGGKWRVHFVSCVALPDAAAERWGSGLGVGWGGELPITSEVNARCK